MRRMTVVAAIATGALVAGCGGDESGGDSVEIGDVRYEVTSARSGEASEIVPGDHVVVRVEASGDLDVIPRVGASQFSLDTGKGEQVPATDAGALRPGSDFATVTEGDTRKLALVFVTRGGTGEEAHLVIRPAYGSTETKTLEVDVEPAGEQPVGG